jgi:S-adenosylmethionine uptake transporter
VPSLFVALVTAAAITAVGGLVSLLGGWAPVAAAHAPYIVPAALCLLVGYLLGVMAMRVGDVGFVSPFRYTSMLWALLLGVLVFDEFPAPPTLVGSVVVVATGLYTLHRERRRSTSGRG